MFRLTILFLLLGLIGPFASAQVWPLEKFRVSYYANPTLSGEPVSSGIDPSVMHNWEFNSPGAILPRDGFSARWRGSFAFSAGTWLFRVNADEGVRLWVDSRLLIDAWPTTGGQKTELITLSEGSHRIEVTYFDGTGTAFIELDWEPYAPASACNATINSWCSEYFPNRTLAEPATQSSEPAALPKLVGSAPAGFPSDGFSARFKGSFAFDEGFYRFSCSARDGVRIWVDDELLLNEWHDQALKTHDPARFLSSGTHQLVVESYRTWGSDSVTLDWQLDTQAPYDASDSPLGMNITALNYYAPEWTLLNVFKASGGWYTQTSNIWDTLEQSTLDTDASGWVRSLPAADSTTQQFRTVAALILNGSSGAYPAGKYLVLYDGEGTLTYGFDGVYNAAESRPGRHVLDVTTPTNGGILLRLIATNPQNYIRNIRVVLAGNLCSDDPYAVSTEPNTSGVNCQSIEEALNQQPFHPAFLRDLRGFRVIRYMDFLETNTSQLVEWADRPTLEDARWNGHYGAPLELVIQLSNQTGTDPWINVPTKASDDFVVKMAELFRQGLDPGRKVYVEYSNELWNTAFPNGSWVESEAVARWPDSSDTAAYLLRLSYAGQRSAEIVSLFKEVFGAESSRVVGVMGGFSANDWFSEQILTCPIAVTHGGTACYEVMDALSVAPYFGAYLGQPRLANAMVPWTADQEQGLDNLFQELTSGGLLYDPQNPNYAPLDGGLAQAAEFTANSARVADKYGLSLFAYEGGQHIVGVGSQMENTALTELFVAANRDPRMEGVYRQYLADWRSQGGSLFCHFLSVQGYGRFGSWGTKETQEQLNAPKFLALQEFINSNPCWWDGCGKPNKVLQPYLPIPFGF